MALTIGGDHSVGTGSIYGSMDSFGKDLKVLWIDAHSDINSIATSPSYNYHGMPVSHLLGVKSMENLPEFQWKKNNLDVSNLVFLGIRELDDGEK